MRTELDLSQVLYLEEMAGNKAKEFEKNYGNAHKEIRYKICKAAGTLADAIAKCSESIDRYKKNVTNLEDVKKELDNFITFSKVYAEEFVKIIDPDKDLKTMNEMIQDLNTVVNNQFKVHVVDAILRI